MASSQLASENEEFSITVQAIPCSFPLRFHPDALHLIEFANSWLLEECKRITAACASSSRSSKLAAKLFAPEHLLNSAFAHLVVVYFANAVSTERVLPILKLNNWYFMIDTCIDEAGMLGTDPSQSTYIIQRVMAVLELDSDAKPTPHHLREAADRHVSKPALHDPITASCSDDIASIVSSQSLMTQELAHILTSTAAEWWSDMRVDMPPSQQARFTKVFIGYLNCLLKESSFRSRCNLPDVHEYIRIRSKTIGWYPYSVLVEYTLGMDMDPEAHSNPLLLALNQSVAVCIFLVNDILSFGKEYERGDYFNIVMVLCRQKLIRAQNTSDAPTPLHNITWPALATPALLQESMNEACEMLRESDQECARLIEEIKASPMLMQKPGMGAFLEAMGNTVAGNIYWHLTSERYGICSTGCRLGQPPDLRLSGTPLSTTILASRTLRLKPSPTISIK